MSWNSVQCEIIHKNERNCLLVSKVKSNTTSKFILSGKEDHLRSPYLDEEFVKAREQGVIPANSRTEDIGGSWSAIRGETGEATNLNLAHVQG